MEQIAAHGALEGDLATTEACFSMNNPRSRGGGTGSKQCAAPQVGPDSSLPTCGRRSATGFAMSVKPELEGRGVGPSSR